MYLPSYLAFDLLSVDGRYLSDANYISQLDKRFPFEATKADRAILAQERQRIADFDTQWESAKGRWEGRLDAKLTRRYNRVIDAAAFEVLNANSHYRVFDLANPFNDARTSYFHKSVGGYHGAKLRRYQEFIERVLTPERAAVIQSIQSGNFNLTADLAPGLAMLNTRYLLVPGAEQPLPFNGGLGPAWFVDEVQWVNTAEEEIGAVADLNPARTAAVHQSFEEVLGRLGNPGSNEVRLAQYHPEGSTYEVSSDKGGLLVLSEVHYPVGWTALVDGEEVPLVRANALLSALKVPAGSHEVQLQYEPVGWGTARGLSRAGSLLWLMLLVFCGWMHRREAE